jgi:hypothetical protein
VRVKNAAIRLVSRRCAEGTQMGASALAVLIMLQTSV